MKRKIIHIDDDICTGCGNCIPNCPEGALQMIDGKARLVSDLFCDGLGACLGECPEGAITIEEREAQPYDERGVMATIVKQGSNVIRAHLDHLEEHGETEYHEQALAYLKEQGVEIGSPAAGSPAAGSPAAGSPAAMHTGCPGARVLDFDREESNYEDTSARPSELRQWPIQLHLIPPSAPYFEQADVVLAADCVAYTVGDFHKNYLKGKKLAIACPKLDENQDIYLDKLVALIDFAAINSLTVITMEVPCCMGLLQLARSAAEKSERAISINWIKIGIQGDVIQEAKVS